MKKLLAVTFALALIASACGGGTSVLGGGDSFCDLGTERAEQEAAFETIDFTDPGAVESAFKANRDLINRAVASAPAVVKADLELVREDFLLAFAAFEAADWDVFSATEPEEVSGAEAAGDRIDAYLLNECGVDLTESEGPTEEDLIDQLDGSERGQELVVTALVQAGLDPSQAACLAEVISIEEFTSITGDDIPANVLNSFQDCGVSQSVRPRRTGRGRP